jgi:hypothetical protein
VQRGFVRIPGGRGCVGPPCEERFDYFGVARKRRKMQRQEPCPIGYVDFRTVLQEELDNRQTYRKAASWRGVLPSALTPFGSARTPRSSETISVSPLVMA